MTNELRKAAISYIRLRQICLVAPQLEPVVTDICAILGLEVCYRDRHVEKYGLVNALMPVDTILLEVVAPFRDGTAAGRFLSKTGGRGGYMAIFCCDDPDAYAKRANAIGVRTANVIDHAPYHGVQLHPRDCRAVFIEFNHTEGSDDVLGPYPPAGPDWQHSIRKDVTQALTEVEIQSPDPHELAAHWGQIVGVPAMNSASGEAELKLPNCRFRFVKGESEIMGALTFRVADAARVREAAKARGYSVSDNVFRVGGVDFRLVA
jgi:Glyoxalase-like domain